MACLLITFQACSQVKPLATIKLRKPIPPVLKPISIIDDLDCFDESQKQMCDIVLNVSNLMRYICVLEANPTWDKSSPDLCPVQ